MVIPTNDELALANLLHQESYEAHTWMVLIRSSKNGKPYHIVGIYSIKELNEQVAAFQKKYGTENFRLALRRFDSDDYTAYRIGYNIAPDKIEAAKAIKDIMANSVDDVDTNG